MPELPEVETVRRILNQSIVGKKILDINIRYGKIIQNTSIEEFKNSLIGETFINVNRKGKYLICELNNYYLIVHLRMEGKFFLMHDEELSKHDHIIFIFSDSNLRYNDTRKFGTMHLFKKDIDIYNVYPLNNVGLEPFDEGFTVDYLKSNLSHNTRAIKTALLDQSIVAGLGNIYVDEVLFMSNINPTTSANKITDEQLKKIINNSKIVLEKAIKLGGTTIRSFQSRHDITGRFQNELLVHTKEICPICHSKIEKIRVGGRGTYYCPNCQK